MPSTEKDRTRTLSELPPYYANRDPFSSTRIALLVVNQSLLWTYGFFQSGSPGDPEPKLAPPRPIEINIYDQAPPYKRGHHDFGSEVRYMPPSASGTVAPILEILKQSPSWRIVQAVDFGNYEKLLKDLDSAQKNPKIGSETENFIKRCVLRAADRGIKPPFDFPSATKDLVLEIIKEGLPPIQQEEIVNLLVYWLSKIPEEVLHKVGAERRKPDILLPDRLSQLDLSQAG